MPNEAESQTGTAAGGVRSGYRCPWRPLLWMVCFDRRCLVGQRQDQETPYTSMVPTGDDYYLLRQLNTRVKLAQKSVAGPLYTEEEGVQGMYLSGATYSADMAYADSTMEQYRDELLRTLVDGGVLPQAWMEQIKQEMDYWAGPTYYSTDSLGFVRLVTCVGENSDICILNLEADSLTGKVVALWISAEQGHEIDRRQFARPGWN